MDSTDELIAFVQRLTTTDESLSFDDRRWYDGGWLRWSSDARLGVWLSPDGQLVRLYEVDAQDDLSSPEPIAETTLAALQANEDNPISFETVDSLHELTDSEVAPAGGDVLVLSVY